MVFSEGSIWEIAVTDARKRMEGGTQDTNAGSDGSPRQATLLFVGNRGSGKTTLIQKFLEREELPKATLALEYTYARKSGKSMAKDVCHIWELGGADAFSSLLSTPLNRRSISALSIVVVVDLSSPETLWNTLERLLKNINQRIMDIMAEPEGRNLHSRLTDAAWKKFGKDHPDKEHLKPCLVPLVIIGGKYDIFQDMDPESKKVTCRALRYVAHTFGASLLFFTPKDSGLVKRAKEMLSHHGFGSSEGKILSQDYNKPLIIPAGSDSLHFISGLAEGDSAAMSFEAWKRIFTTKFPQEENTASTLLADPSKDPHYEEFDIDNLRAQKDQELERLRREVGVEARPKSTRRR